MSEGDIGEKEHVRVSRKKMAEIEADTQISENERTREIYQSATQLDISKSNFERDKQIASYEALALAQLKQIEFQQQVEESRKSLEERTIRAKDMSQATVKAEVLMKHEEGEIMARKMVTEVEAQIFVIQAKAQFEKQKINAEAELFTKQKESDAVLYGEQQKAQAYLVTKEAEAKGIEKIKEAEAKGIEMVKTAEAVGLAALIKSSNGDIKSLSQYIVATNGTLTEIANAQASAVRGMKPTVWVTSGGSGTTAGSFSNAMTDIIKTGIPLAQAIKDQTGVDILTTLNVKSDPVFHKESGEGEGKMIVQ
jgi:flotillin